MSELNSEVAVLKKANAVSSKELLLLRKQRDEVLNKYNNGLTKIESEAMKKQVESLEEEVSRLTLERDRYVEIASAASQQTKQVLSLRESHNEELVMLRNKVTELESSGEDQLIIGRLQRQLTATKTSYKSFVRKYEAALSRARKKEAAARKLEEKLDKREKAFHALGVEKRLQVSALKSALAVLTGSLLAGDQAIELAHAAYTRVSLTKQQQLHKKNGPTTTTSTTNEEKGVLAFQFEDLFSKASSNDSHTSFKGENKFKKNEKDIKFEEGNGGGGINDVLSKLGCSSGVLFHIEEIQSKMMKLVKVNDECNHQLKESGERIKQLEDLVKVCVLERRRRRRRIYI
jgi:hypothetical protein